MIARERHATTPPPRVLRLAGHELRWRILSELAHSDRRVSELTDRAQRRQSLVSYHLRQLREGGLVTMRRSDNDARDAYYALDLARFSDHLASAGAALHPGLARTPPSARQQRDRESARVLFLCTGNSSRSQIAEALASELSEGAISARSAGSDPRSLHPNAVQVMTERGVDIAGRRTKHLSEFAGERFDYVITLCDRVREVCPEFPGGPEVIHWSIPDPGRVPGGKAETLPAFEAVADELSTRIGFLLQVIEQTRGGDVTWQTTS